MGALCGRITGRGEDLESTMDSAVVPFGDIIAARERGLTAENADAWRTAVEGTWYGRSVTMAWGHDVLAYERLLGSLRQRWEDAVADDFGVPPPEGGLTTEYEEGLAAAQHALATELNGLAEAAYEKLRRRAAMYGQQLTGGPTAANLKTLVESGAMGWSAYNLWGDKAATPVDADLGDVLATLLRDGLRSLAGPPGEFGRWQRQGLLQLRAVAEHAEWCQAHGGSLTAAELGFLERYYAVLGDAIYDVADYASRLPAEDAELTRAAVGGGLLALSDEGIGGGYASIPAQVRFHLEDSRTGGWTRMAALAPLLATAHRGLRAGKDFSVRTTSYVADRVAALDGESLEDAQRVLAVSTRTVPADAAILAGAYTYSTSPGHSRDRLLRELFGTRWPDRGLAVSGLLRWIPEYAAGDAYSYRDWAYKRGLAGSAAAGLIVTLAGGGGPARIEPTDRSFGEIGRTNPELAHALARIAAQYLESFSAAPAREPRTTWNDGELTVAPAHRRRFFRLVAADRGAAEWLAMKVGAHMDDDGAPSAERVGELAALRKALNGD